MIFIVKVNGKTSHTPFGTMELYNLLTRLFATDREAVIEVRLVRP